MKRLLLTIVLFMFVISSQASHLKGGYITYKWQTGRTYQITLVLFSDPNSPANINTISAVLNLGDGTDSAVIQRTEKVAISTSVAENIYITTYTYQADGDYIISCTNFNFIDGIVNVNGGNSLSQQFYIETMIHINAFSGTVNSPEPHSILPDVRALGGKELYYNSTWFSKPTNQINFGTDSISYSFSPMQNIANYSLPQGMSIDNYSGMIKWENVPIVSGTMDLLYLLNYKVSFYRQTILMGYTTVAQILKVDNYPGSFPSIIHFPLCDSTNNGWYKKSVTSNNSFQQEFNYADTNYQFMKRVYGETNVSTTDSSISSLSKTIINFTSDTNLIQRTQPYFYTIRIIKDSSIGIPYFKDYNLAVYFGASTYFGLNEMNSKNIFVNVYPNPTTGIFEISINSIDANSIRVMDINGKTILERKNISSKESIDMTGFAKGVYILTISGTEFSLNKKLIIE